VDEPLKILPRCLRKKQRIQDQALILLAHVVDPAPGPCHVQRQLDLARSRPPEVFQRRRQAACIRAPARRQATSLHKDNYPLVPRATSSRHAAHRPSLRPSSARHSRGSNGQKVVSAVQNQFLPVQTQSILQTSS
jgi:hypothetical protein